MPVGPSLTPLFLSHRLSPDCPIVATQLPTHCFIPTVNQLSNSLPALITHTQLRCQCPSPALHNILETLLLINPRPIHNPRQQQVNSSTTQRMSASVTIRIKLRCIKTCLYLFFDSASDPVLLHTITHGALDVFAVRLPSVGPVPPRRLHAPNACALHQLLHHVVRRQAQDKVLLGPHRQERRLGPQRNRRAERVGNQGQETELTTLLLRD